MAVFSLAFDARHVRAADQARPPESTIKATSPKLPDRITTLDGKTYEKVTLQKVDPDGLLVQFAPAEGGSGAAKLKFRNLPPELREQFGYDPARASDFETAHARGEATWLAESAAREEQRRAALAEQAAQEKQMREQTEARLAAEAEQARIDAANGAQQPPDYYPGWWWPNTYNSIPQHHRDGSHQNPMRRQPTPAGNSSSPTSPQMGPMRPTGR